MPAKTDLNGKEFISKALTDSYIRYNEFVSSTCVKRIWRNWQIKNLNRESKILIYLENIWLFEV